MVTLYVSPQIDATSGVMDYDGLEAYVKKMIAQDESVGVLDYEPLYKKTCLRGFQPGLTQTGLYNHRR